jgi:hypothetical protein
MATHYKPTSAKLAEYTTPCYEFRDFPIDTPVASLLDPETWAHVAKRFRVGDEIMVKPQGLPYRAHLIVMDAGAVFAKVKLLTLVPLNAGEASGDVQKSSADGRPMYVKWNLGSKKYAIHRSSDNEKVHEGFAVKADAEAWAAKHTMALAT